MLRSIRITAALACSIGAAHAEVVVHNNYDPGLPPAERIGFDWTRRHSQMTTSQPGQWLDITLPASSQTGAASLKSLIYVYSPAASSSTPGNDSIQSYRGPSGNLTPQAFLAEGPGVVLISPNLGPLTIDAPLELLPGETVDPSLSFPTAPSPTLKTWFRWSQAAVSAPLIEVHTFVGVRLTLPTGTHYGWIELLRTSMLPSQQWYPLRWAYETTPDTPITVPPLLALAPGTFPCPNDLDGDGVVGASDLSIVLGSWGQGETAAGALAPPTNLVNSADLAAVLGSWGVCP